MRAMFARLKGAGGAGVIQSPAVKQQMAMAGQASAATNSLLQAKPLQRTKLAYAGSRQASTLGKPQAHSTISRAAGKLKAKRAGGPSLTTPPISSGAGTAKLHAAANKIKAGPQPKKGPITGDELLDLHHRALAGDKAARAMMKVHPEGRKLADAAEAAFKATAKHLAHSTGVDPKVIDKAMDHARKESAARHIYHAVREKLLAGREASHEMMARAREAYAMGHEHGVQAAEAMPGG